MFKFKDENVTIKVYNYFSSTKEYVGESDCFILAGTGLPAHSTEIKVPDDYLNVDGFKAVFDEVADVWLLIKDYRGKVVYNIETKQPLVISSLGELPEDVTITEPTEFDKWDGKKWVEDALAKQAFIREQSQTQKVSLLAEANQQISILQDAIDFEMADDGDENKLKEWKKYRVLLSRIDTSLAYIEWPQKPN